jgi:K+-sensing histidine kinase KdpD
MLLLRPLMESSIFFLFVAAVAISAMYGGLGPGLMASLISALEINYFFLLPYNALLSSTEDTLQLVVFLATGVIISSGLPRATSEPRTNCARVTRTWRGG